VECILIFLKEHCDWCFLNALQFHEFSLLHVEGTHSFHHSLNHVEFVLCAVGAYMTLEYTHIYQIFCVSLIVHFWHTPFLMMFRILLSGICAMEVVYM
jgi:hypothetical protein